MLDFLFIYLKRVNTDSINKWLQNLYKKNTAQTFSSNDIQW